MQRHHSISFDLVTLLTNPVLELGLLLSVFVFQVVLSRAISITAMKNHDRKKNSVHMKTSLLFSNFLDALRAVFIEKKIATFVQKYLDILMFVNCNGKIL